MTSTSPEPEKKIIVDEDWKRQVEAEKEAARRAEQSEESGKEAGSAEPLPPADLMFLIGSLYLQAAVSLGLMPNPLTKKIEVRLDHAKHTIDLLAMLEEKTAGNRTLEESEELEAVLHQLRLAYLAAQNTK